MPWPGGGSRHPYVPDKGLGGTVAAVADGVTVVVWIGAWSPRRRTGKDVAHPVSEDCDQSDEDVDVVFGR
jgi:hypothetical protein